MHESSDAWRVSVFLPPGKLEGVFFFSMHVFVLFKTRVEYHKISSLLSKNTWKLANQIHRRPGFGDYSKTCKSNFKIYCGILQRPTLKCRCLIGIGDNMKQSHPWWDKNQRAGGLDQEGLAASWGTALFMCYTFEATVWFAYVLVYLIPRPWCCFYLIPRPWCCFCMWPGYEANFLCVLFTHFKCIYPTRHSFPREPISPCSFVLVGWMMRIQPMPDQVQKMSTLPLTQTEWGTTHTRTHTLLTHTPLYRPKQSEAVYTIAV